MDARIDWIWLQQALGPGNAKAGRLLSHFCSASAVWEAEPREWLEAGLSVTEQERLAQRDRDSARRLLDAVLSAQNPGLNPELIHSAFCQEYPQFRPDMVTFHRREVLDKDGTPFR